MWVLLLDINLPNDWKIKNESAILSFIELIELKVIYSLNEGASIWNNQLDIKSC